MSLTTTENLPETSRQFISRRGDLNVFRLIAHAPTVFEGWAQMVDAMLDSTTFTDRVRELTILRVAHLQGSPYEITQHTELAQAAGLTDRQIAAITGTGEIDSTDFTDTERIVLNTVTELCATRTLKDQSFAAAHTALGDEALTELLMIISCYYGLAFVLNAVDLDIDAGRLQT